MYLNLIKVLLAFLFIVGGGFGLYKLMNSETYQVYGEIIPRVETKDKVVALTFDDGPNENTHQILSLLQKYDVQATFFLVGRDMAKFSPETKQLIEAGHQVGNHSYTHKRMIFKSPSFIRYEINETTKLLEDYGYTEEIMFRPPYGKKLFYLPWHLQQQGVKTVMWDIEPLKALGQNAKTKDITKYVIENVRPGSIILLHPWYGSSNDSRDSIPQIIDALRADGYEFVTVAELLEY